MPPPSEKSDFRKRKYRVPSKKPPSSIREMLREITHGPKKEESRFQVPQKRRQKTEKKEEVAKKEEKPSLFKGGYAESIKIERELQKYEHYSPQIPSVKERRELAKRWFKKKGHFSPQDVEKARKDIDKRFFSTHDYKEKPKIREEKKLFERIFPKKNP